MGSTTPEMVATLLEAGASLEARAEGGWTPLHAAATLSKTSTVVATLLEAGADPAAEDADGNTPWELIEDDSPLKGTDLYWQLNEARFR